MDTETAEVGEDAGLDLEHLDLEGIPCSWSYACICIIMPALNGFINGYFWSGYSLYYVEMGWPLVRAGLAVTMGFGLRVITQQLLLRVGYWGAVPMSAIHLVIVILAVIYNTTEVAVSCQLGALIGLDPTCAIEGISFDAFSASEVQARQASSTVLSVYTIAVASSCTVGGILYDFLGWKGMTMYHCICQGILFLLFLSQPACRESFKQNFFPTKGTPEELDDGSHVQVQVVPSANPDAKLPALPGVPDLHLQDVDAVTPLSVRSREAKPGPGLEDSAPKGTPLSVRSKQAEEKAPVRGSQASIASKRYSRASYHSVVSARQSRLSAASKNTRNTHQSHVTMLSMVSRMTALREAGDDFRCHGATNAAILPMIVGATGGQGVVRDEVPPLDEPAFEEKSKGFPKDLRLPALLLAMNSFCNMMCYNIEFGSFAIYFKDVYGWNDAVFASLAQTAGDVTAALAMQVAPYFLPNSGDPDEMNRFSRTVYYLISQPYNLSLIIVLWVITNIGMMAPVLAVAIVAQVLMGTVYVYSFKMTTELCLFFSLGDPQVFLALQTYCRNAEAVGGSVAGVVATVLYTLDPVAPFAFAGTMALLMLIVYTSGFCARLGFGDDIEMAESKRSRRLGLRRVSSWAADVRKSTAETK